jgi:hypothetical protein
MTMKNHFTSPMSYRKETVVQAWKATRPKQMPGPADHHGVMLKTREGNTWLIHDTPDTGVTCTSADNMSSKWTKTEIKLAWNPRIGQCMKGAAGVMGKHWKPGFIQYLLALTCIKTADRLESFLIKQPK